MKVLITGAGGFIGSHLVEDQLSRGRQVVALDVKPGFLQPILQVRGLTYVHDDIRNTECLQRALKDVEIVFHLASAHLEVGLSEQHYYDVNVNGVRKLLEASKNAGVRRFIHCSSVGVYGTVQAPPADEKSPCRPILLYEKTKLSGEKMALQYFHETGFPVVIIRPAWVFGPRCRRTQKLLSALGKGRFLLVGKCQNYRHPVYIKDMVKAFELAAQSRSVDGEILIVGADHAVKLKELITTICDVTCSKYPKLTIPLEVWPWSSKWTPFFSYI